MPYNNSIALRDQYVTLLDEVYKRESLTAVLDGSNELVRQGAKAEELVIPKLTMNGLGDYSRSNGYVDGDVTLDYETVKCNFDRGRMFQVDYLDDEESANIAFGRLAGEFERIKVIPEEDAFRFATYAGNAVKNSHATSADLSAGGDVVAALRVGVNAMDEGEVPLDERYLYITPTLFGMVQDLDTTKSREVLSRFARVIQVPQTRFYTAIDQYDGSTTGETAGGFVKDSKGKNINFLMVHRPAVIQFTKHLAPKIITPDQNQSADAYKFGYRKVGIADVYENKEVGIYCHYATA